MKDFRIVAKIYNNQLRERREATGLGIYEFAQSIGMSGGDYGAYESMKMSPLTSGKGPYGRTLPKRWKRGAVAIAEALNVGLAVLWPEAVLEIKKTVSEVRVDAADIAAMLPPAVSTPFLLLSAAEETGALAEAMSVLSPTEKVVIAARFGLDGDGEKTFAEIGDEMMLSRERIRQIQNRGLDKIQRQLKSAGHES